MKPPEPERKKSEPLEEEVVEIRAPIATAMPRPPFDSPLTKLQPVVNENFRKTIDDLVVQKKAAAKEAESDVIAVGTKCRNGGCLESYQSEDSLYSECVHHPGVPVFHEGMKYWSCCQRKTSDFSVFVAQKGCETGRHKWTEEKKDNDAVQCRYDWHQTGNNVVVAIYAKMYDYRVSYVQLNPIRLKVHLVFPQQSMAAFDLDLELRGIVDVGKSSVNMMGTKVEINLCKAELGSWPKLGFPPKVEAPKTAPEPQVSLDDLRIEKEAVSDDDVDLGDVEPVYSGAKITEILE